jgi:hypothetical protein
MTPGLYKLLVGNYACSAGDLILVLEVDPFTINDGHDGESAYYSFLVLEPNGKVHRWSFIKQDVDVFLQRVSV